MLINRRQTTHLFEKQNLFTISSGNRSYDVFKCARCGLTGKAYSLTHITITKKGASDSCPKADRPTKIKITHCHAHGKAFENLKPGSVHTVIDAPADQPNNLAGVWVMGVGEPVKVLVDEYEEIQ